jgi:hypothetical protein
MMPVIFRYLFNLLSVCCQWYFALSTVIPVLGQMMYELSTPLFCGSVAILVTLLVRWWYHGWKRTSSVPKRWQRVGELSELMLFPVKSCAGS